jgi:hypothetical protein
MSARMRLVLMFASLACLATTSASAQLYGTNAQANSGGNGGALYQFDPDSGAYVNGSGIQVTLAGSTVTGVLSVTIDPTDGTAYMILKVSGVPGGRVLATVNLATGVATQVGNLGDNFSSLTFRADGQLFGVTGDGAAVPETLYLIDKATAAKTLATALGNGDDGEVIAYNPDDGLIYHWSGNAARVFETILATAPYTVTDVPISGSPSAETFGAVYDACRNVFIASASDSTFRLWNPDGTVGASYALNPADIRGLALLPANSCNVDLSISISATPAVPTAGNPVTLTVTVLNNGPARALSPSVAVSLAANITGSSTTGCAEDPTGVPTCSLATLQSGDSTSFTIDGTFTGGVGTTTVTATTSSDETAPADNTASLLLGAAINVTPTSGLVTDEGGSTANFSVVLGSPPSGDVSVPLSSSDPGEGSLAISSLLFTPANWDTAQVVTVTGVDDFIIDGAQAYTIILAPASSADARYDGLDPNDVAVTNNDNDVAGVQVTPPATPTTTEAGGTAVISVSLTAQPGADVSFPVASSDTSEGTLAIASITFTPANWNVPQDIIVTGADDFLVDGDVAYSVVLGVTSSGDGNFNGLDPADVNLTNLDDDVAGVGVNPASGLMTTEAGGSASFDAVLTAQPTADVSMAVSSSTPSEATVAPASLTFTSANWNVPQTVTVTGVDDIVIDGDQPFTISVGPTVSADTNFDGIGPVDVSGINADDDVPQLPLPGPGGIALSLLALLLLGAATLSPRFVSRASGD